MTDHTSHDLAAGGDHRPGWVRRLHGALPGLLYAAMVLALFGGIAVDHLPQSPMVRLALVGGGAALLLLLALWLDRREDRHADAEREAHGQRRALGTGD
ncbi:MAG TPA: hypothetical protein VE397_07145 [Stellaceae bacterium]|nr:hypothetical protein [Stellaceae bacterium]